MAGRRIGFLIDWRLFRTPDGLRAESPMLQFALAFRAHFDEIVLIARVFERNESAGLPYAVPDERVRIAALPPYPRIHSLYTRPLHWWPPIERALRGTLPLLDALWLNFGHPVSLRALALSDRHADLRPVQTNRPTVETRSQIQVVADCMFPARQRRRLVDNRHRHAREQERLDQIPHAPQFRRRDVCRGPFPAAGWLGERR